jgi:AraC-like DNA-binding protein
MPMTNRTHAGEPRGILKSDPVPGRHLRLLPSPELAVFVEHFWLVSWQLGDAPAQIAETLPHPCVHIVFERGETAELVGVHNGRFRRALRGNGEVFGIKFRPGGFYPFWQKPISALVDRRLPLTEAFGAHGLALAQAMARVDDDETQMQLAEQFLHQRLPAADSQVALIDRIVSRIVDDRSINKVDAIADEFALTARSLQRLFQRYVGVSPKWMIQRYRLHEALVQLHRATAPDWPQFALALGYSDQAHFIRNFKLLVGRTPAEYWQQRG